MKQKSDEEVLFMHNSVSVFPPKNFVPFTFTPHFQFGEAEGVPLLLDMRLLGGRSRSNIASHSMGT